MRLICTDASWRDLCALGECTMDMEFGDGGDDANTFELRIPVGSAPDGLAFGSLVYVDGTEYGGVVDDIGSDTTGKVHKALFGGRTWHGVLEGRVLRPDRGADYLSVSGEANAVLLQLVHRMGLAGLFAVDASDSGIRVSHRFARYVAGYTGLRAMLAPAGAKLAMRWDGGRVVLSAAPRRDWSSEEFEGRRTPIRINLASRPVNHLVCLGKGDLAARTVVDLFADEDGNVSKTQTLFGVDEVELAYDYSSAEDDELEEQGRKRLAELQDASTCDVPELPSADFDVGDVVGGRDSRLGIYVSAPIARKVVTIGKRGVTSACEAGGATSRRVTRAL